MHLPRLFCRLICSMWPRTVASINNSPLFHRRDSLKNFKDYPFSETTLVLYRLQWRPPPIPAVVCLIHLLSLSLLSIQRTLSVLARSRDWQWADKNNCNGPPAAAMHQKPILSDLWMFMHPRSLEIASKSFSHSIRPFGHICSSIRGSFVSVTKQIAWFKCQAKVQAIAAVKLGAKTQLNISYYN